MAKKSESLSPAQIAGLWQSEHAHTWYGGDHYVFDGTCYRLVEPEAIQASIIELMSTSGESDAITRGHLADVMTILQAANHVPATRVPPTWLRTAQAEAGGQLVMRNGILDTSPLRAGEDPILSPHTSDLFVVSRTSYDYVPDVHCAEFEDFLIWFASGDPEVAELVLEFMAYILLGWLSLQRFLVLVGCGANGKSVLLSVLRKLIGEGACSAVTLERFSHRFTAHSFLRSRLNIAADMNQISKVAEGELKAFCDESPVAVEKKYRDVQLVSLKTRFVFSTNIFPRFTDRSQGIWRRLMLIRCEAIVSPGREVRKLEDRFNMSGVLNMVIDAGRRLIERGDFLIPSAVRRWVEEERVSANPAQDFIGSHFQVESGSFVGLKGTYLGYKVWLENNGFKGSLAYPNFAKEFCAVFRNELNEGVVSAGKSRKEHGFEERVNGYHGIAYYVNGVPEVEVDIDYQEEFGF